MRQFDRSIKKILEKYAYDVYLVQQDFAVKCVCVDLATQQAKPDCPKCLGTGKKIMIKKIKAAGQNAQVSIRTYNTNEFITTGVYFIDAKYPVRYDNILVDGNDVHVIQKVDKNNTEDGNNIYQKCDTVYKKSNVIEFLKNFHAIIGR